MAEDAFSLARYLRGLAVRLRGADGMAVTYYKNYEKMYKKTFTYKETQFEKPLVG